MKLSSRIWCFAILLIMMGVAIAVEASQFDPLEEIYKVRGVVHVPQTSAAPTIDGKISETEWDCASAFTGFFGYNEQKLVADSPTAFAAYDSQSLYLLCLIPEEDGRPSVARETERDSQVHRDDSVEIYLNIGDSDLYQIVINPLGTVADYKNSNIDWNGNYSVATGQITGSELPARWSMLDRPYWFAELAIPFSSLGVEAPKYGDKWTTNIGINRNGAWAVLAPVKAKVFADTSAFYDMVFLGPNEPYAQITSLGNVRFGEARVSGKLFNPGAEAVKIALDVDMRKEGSYLTHDAYRNIIGVISSVTEPFTLAAGSSLPVTVDNTVLDTCVNLIAVRAAVVDQSTQKRKDLLITHGSVQVDPPLVLKIGNYPSSRYVVLDVDTSGVKSRVGEREVDYVVEVHDANGKVVRSIQSSAAVGLTEIRIDYSDLPTGNYKCLVSVECDGKKLAQSEAAFRSLEEPVWLTSRIYDDYGKMDRVPLPWKPVAVQDKTVSVWGRTMTWNEASILPSSITSQGVELLKQPMRLVAIIDGRDYVVPLNNFAVTEKKKKRVSMTADGAVNGLTVAADMWVEYDGLLWMNLAVRDTVAGRKVSALRVVTEMDTAKTPLYQSHNNAMTGYIGDDLIKFDWLSNPNECVVNFYHWFGNEDMGLGFTYTTLEHWAPETMTNFATLSPGKQFRTYSINLVEKPVSVDGKSFVFGVQATPIKPLPPDYHSLMAGSINSHQPWKAPRVIPENYDIWLPWPEPVSTIMLGLNNPYNVDEQQMADAVKYAHDNGVAVTTVASCPQKVSPNDEYFNDYIAEWKVLPESVLNWNGTTQVQNCGKSYTLRKWLFYGWAIENVKKFGTEGIYYDGWQAGSIACSNPHHGCGWVDENGTRHVVVPVLEGREFNHRMCLWLEDNVDSPYYGAKTAPERKGFPRYHYWIHSWCFAPSVMGFATEWLTGEFTGWPQKGPSMLTPEGTYGKCSGLGEIRTRALSTNWGVPNLFDALMWEHEENSPNMQTLNALAWFLPHGIPFGLTEYVNQKTLVEVTRLMMDFETRKSEFIPAWRPNPHIEIVSPVAREVMVATWEHPSKSKVLAVVSNLKVEETHDVVLKWKGFANASLKNARTGEQLPLKNGTLTVNLGPESFILIEISK